MTQSSVYLEDKNKVQSRPEKKTKIYLWPPVANVNIASGSDYHEVTTPHMQYTDLPSIPQRKE